MNNESRNKKLLEVIGLILQEHGGVLYSKTKLVKLLYLLDRHFVQQRNMPLTGIKYKSYFYGPYSEEIDVALKYLQEKGFLRIKVSENFFGIPYYIIELTSFPDFKALTDEEVKEIRNFVSKYVDKSLDEILEEVYETKEYKETEFGEVIKFV